MKNLCAINPYDVDSLIGNYNKKINRTRNPILIYKEDIFPKINNRKTLNSFKKKQINIPILMNNTSNNFVENNKKRFNSNYTEPSVIIDKNAKNKKKYCPKDYLLSVKYLKFLKQEDLRDNNYFERIYRSDSDSDDDENYMIAKLKAKNKLKENLKKIDFDKQLQFLMELDNIPKYVLESNAERIIQSLPHASWEQERIALIKSKCHEYDQEWRMILRSPANGPIMQEWVPYGIVLGLRTNSRDKSTIIRSAKLAGIDHFFATYINDSNRLDIRPL